MKKSNFRLLSSTFSFFLKRGIKFSKIKFSQQGASIQLKFILLHSLCLLKERVKNPFGIFIILGWKEKWKTKYYTLADIEENIFKDRPVNISLKSPQEIYKIFLSIKDFDGAVLIRKDGTITNSGVFIENLAPKKVAHKLNLRFEKDLASTFGFKTRVHTRHLSAIAASYQLPQTTIYTISEENRILRIYEKGKIIYSTFKKEMEFK